VIADLEQAGRLRVVFQVTGIGPTLDGHNGGGDRYYTDGEMDVGVLRPTDAPRGSAPQVLANPTAVDVKNRVWRRLRPWLERW
jgi:hypothetical protein